MAKKKYLTLKDARIAKNAAGRLRYATKKSQINTPERIKAKRLARSRYYHKHANRINAERRKRWSIDHSLRTRSLESNKKWKEKNRTRHDEYHSKYRLLHAKQRGLSSRRYAEKHHDRVLEYGKKYRTTMRNELRAKARSKYAINLEESRIKISNRRAARNKHPQANAINIKEVVREAITLTQKMSVKHHIDHIIPLSCGGWHHEKNLQPLPCFLNQSKKHNPFWLSPSPSYKDWRDVPRDLWPLDLVPKYLALIDQHKGESIRWDTAA
jgi:hypothetical protein